VITQITKLSHQHWPVEDLNSKADLNAPANSNSH